MEPLWDPHDGVTIYNTEGTYTVTLMEYHKLCNKSKSYAIQTAKGVGIAEGKYADLPLRVYPNPTTGELIIHIPNPSEGGAYMENIEIFSIVGQTLMTLKTLGTIETIGLREMIIDVSSLANGMYFLRVGNKVVRFVRE
jgi:hypothetical protein